MRKLYQICNRCIMDTSDPDIKFDKNGFCNHCNDYFSISLNYLLPKDSRTKKLEKVLNEIKRKGKGKEYDAVIGLSGGVDSSYVAYITKKLGLRVLAVHFDNGWNTELSIKNIENIVKKLEFDFQTIVVDWEEFKDLQIAFLKASVPNIEIPTDHALLATLYKICGQFKVKYIIIGSNFVTEAILPKSWGYNSKDLRHLKAIQRKYGRIRIKTLPTLGIFKEIYYTFFKQIKMIRLLDFVSYNKNDAISTLQKEFGWRSYGGKHYESFFTKFFQGYILPRKFMIDKRRAHLSTLICSNQISRKQAIELIKEEPYPKQQVKEDKEYVLKKLGLSEEDFDDILNASIK